MSISEPCYSTGTYRPTVRWITNYDTNCNITNYFPPFYPPAESVVRVWGRWVAKSVAEAIRWSAQKASEITPLLIPPPYKFKAKSLVSFRMEFRWSARRWKSNT